MKSNFLIKLVVLALVAAFGIGEASAQADKSGANVGDKTGRVSQAAQTAARLQMAYSAAKYGRENKDADAMIFAAKILKENRVGSSTLPKTTEGGTDDEVTKTTAPDQTPEAFLADAKKFARSDKTLLARIADVEKIKTRGAVGGAKRNLEQVKAKATDFYKVDFKGGEQGIVIISGDGSTDLDLYIYDEKGNLVASDTDGMDDCNVRFYPKWTGTFQIRVKNLGKVYNRYAMVTN